MVQFVRRGGNFGPGERLVVISRLDGDHLLVRRSDGRQERLALKDARAFAVYETSKLELSTGDKIRVTQNGSADATTFLPGPASAVRIHNGTLLTVTGFSPAGDIQCAGGLVLGQDFVHRASGYCLTSHAASR